MIPPTPVPSLRVLGEVNNPTEFEYEDFVAFPAADQVLDVSRFHPQRQGDAITLEALLAHVQPKPQAKYLTLHAVADHFAASIPLDAVRSEGMLVYRLHGGPLPVSKGGPFRFLIRDPAACHTDELDDCANVKFVDLIVLSSERGEDTRPSNEREHDALH